jgi:hypothetical protein
MFPGDRCEDALKGRHFQIPARVQWRTLQRRFNLPRQVDDDDMSARRENGDDAKEWDEEYNTCG